MEKNKISIIYNINHQKTINIFGQIFVENNKNNCKIIFNQKEYDLTPTFIIEEDINLNYLKIVLIIKKNIIDASYMFNNCTSLISCQEICNLNTSEIISMRYMFNNCISLIS